MERLAAPRGTADLIPPQSRSWQELEARIHAIARRFGYGEIRTPMFEATELFVRGVGDATDIVEKEMYTFLDKGDRSLTLRPEWTAPVVRAILQHNLLAAGSLRLYYVGPFFRYERPQAGRYRQANQFGVECLGFAGAEADVEVIQLAAELLRAYGIDATLEINSIGDAACRPAYREALFAHFRPLAAELSGDSRRRLERNPMRILDSKAAEDRDAIATAPAFADVLCAPCAAHFARVRTLLDDVRVPYRVNPRLVRGFDYYTRTVFEFTSSALGSQSAVCGGGRYDDLVHTLGGPPTPAVGFGLGIERFLMVVDALGLAPAPERGGIAAIALGETARTHLLPVVAELRRLTDVSTTFDYNDSKLATHLKRADRVGARVAIIAGEDELAARALQVRDLERRTQGTVVEGSDPAATARAILAWYSEANALPSLHEVAG